MNELRWIKMSDGQTVLHTLKVGEPRGEFTEIKWVPVPVVDQEN